MLDAWWSADVAQIVGPLSGGLGGVIGGLSGGLGGYLAARGKARRWMLGLFGLLAAIGVVMLAAGVIGVVIGQPWYVWFPLVLSGAVYTAVYPPCLWLLNRGYRHAEERRLAAEELRRS